MRRAAERIGLDPRALVGLVVLLGGTLLWVIAFTGGLSTLFSSPTRTVKADFASVEDIVPNDPVRIHGVQVGTVSAITPDPGGRGGTLTMNIDTSDPIYRNASANILWRTVLGATDAVSIDPGTRAAGLLGDATLPQSQDSNQVELDQITQALHDGAQQGLRTMLQQLGPALSSHPDLGLDLNTLAGIAPEATVGIGALRGEVQDTDLKNLVRDAGQATQALSVGTGASETRQFVQSAATTLSTVGGNPANLRNAVIELAHVYADGDKYVFPQYNSLLYRVDPLVAQLNGVVGQVAPTLAALHPALDHAHVLLSDATPLLHKLSPAVDSLARTATVGVPVIDQLKPGLDNLANKVLPGLAEKYPEEGGRAVYQMIGEPLVTFGALSGFFNPDGQIAYLTAGLENPQAQELLPCKLDFSGNDFLVCSTLSQALQEFFTGGTSLLQSLAARPGGEKLFGRLLQGAQRVSGELQQSEQQLAQRLPSVAKLLFPTTQGGAR